jgi:hypothetical protein
VLASALAWATISAESPCLLPRVVGPDSVLGGDRVTGLELRLAASLVDVLGLADLELTVGTDLSLTTVL